MSAGKWADGWQGIDEAKANAEATDVSHRQLLDAYLRRHGWDGASDRDAAIHAALLRKDAAIALLGALDANVYYDSKDEDGARFGGLIQSRKRKAKVIAAGLKIAIRRCIANYEPITNKNVLLRWPDDVCPRPHRNTIAGHLKKGGYV